MKKPTATPVAGTLEQLLFSPKGKLEGLLLKSRGKQIQVTTEPDALDAGALLKAIGQRVELEGTADHSPKAQKGVHPVYSLTKLHRVGGKTPKAALIDHSATTITGVVAALHYARHGEPNGVILETGEFVHLRPHGMKRCGLGVGSTVAVEGERRMTVIGTSLIEAHRVNRREIE